MSHVGERIRRVREAKGLNQAYIAERLSPPVVQTTIGDIEKRADLKVARVREIATILEVDEKLLTDEQSELDAEDVKPVVQRESFRFFVKRASLTSREQKQYSRIVAHKLAPTTVAGWFEVRDLIQQFMGHTPGHRSVPKPSNSGAAAISKNVTDEKKRMARVGVDQLNRSMRRVG